MSVASDVLKYVKKSGGCEESKGDLFVPTAGKYPHIHVNNAFVGVSRTSGGSSTVVSGDTIYWRTLDDFRGDAALGAAIQNVLTYIDATYKR